MKPPTFTSIHSVKKKKEKNFSCRDNRFPVHSNRKSFTVIKRHYTISPAGVDSPADMDAFVSLLLQTGLTSLKRNCVDREMLMVQ